MKEKVLTIAKRVGDFIARTFYLFFLVLIINIFLFYFFSQAIIFNSTLFMIAAIALMFAILFSITGKVAWVTFDVCKIKPWVFFVCYLVFSLVIRFYSMDIYEYYLVNHDDFAISSFSAYYLLYVVNGYLIFPIFFYSYSLFYFLITLLYRFLKKKFSGKRFSFLDSIRYGNDFNEEDLDEEMEDLLEKMRKEEAKEGKKGKKKSEGRG